MKPKPHTHFTTGQPCNCTWAKHVEDVPHLGASIPSIDELAPHRYDQECYEVAGSIANQYPHLAQDAGFYVHPERGAGDHGWNIAPDGTIVDMTAAQHDYAGPEDEPEVEPEPWPAPQHPEIIPPDHPYYNRYVSWTRHPPQAQSIAHQRGLHEGHDDNVEVCPECQTRGRVSKMVWSHGDVWVEKPDPPHGNS